MPTLQAVTSQSYNTQKEETHSLDRAQSPIDQACGQESNTGARVQGTLCIVFFIVCWDG